MLKIIKESKNPELLIVTPLYLQHKISRDTKIGLLRNDINFAWASYEGPGSTSKNFADGIATYRKKHSDPKYVMLVDKDVLPDRHMLDNMYNTLRKSGNDIGFCYCNFEFKGTINKKFHNIQYDPIRLLQSNFISSNSMIKLDKLDEIGGVIVDRKYDRLSDWALWLSFLSYGYYGVLCNSTNFIDISTKSSVSAGSQDEYKRTYSFVRGDFIDPLIDGIII